MRIEHIGNATLYLGDCLEVLPTLPDVDAVITDPIWPNVPAGMFGPCDPFALLSRTADVWGTPKRVVIVMRGDSDPRFLSAIPGRYPFFRACHLPYVIPSYIGRKLGGDELAYCFGEPISSAPGQRVIPGRGPSVQPDGRKANGHPCSRALGHFKWLVRWWAMPDEIVLDPFMGSGTTGVACASLGRQFIGIEIHEPYFDIACERIENAQRQERLFA